MSTHPDVTKAEPGSPSDRAVEIRVHVRNILRRLAQSGGGGGRRP